MIRLIFTQQAIWEILIKPSIYRRNRDLTSPRWRHGKLNRAGGEISSFIPLMHCSIFTFRRLWDIINQHPLSEAAVQPRCHVSPADLTKRTATSLLHHGSPWHRVVTAVYVPPCSQHLLHSLATAELAAPMRKCTERWTWIKGICVLWKKRPNKAAWYLADRNMYDHGNGKDFNVTIWVWIYDAWIQTIHLHSSVVTVFKYLVILVWIKVIFILFCNNCIIHLIQDIPYNISSQQKAFYNWLVWANIFIQWLYNTTQMIK